MMPLSRCIPRTEKPVNAAKTRRAVGTILRNALSSAKNMSCELLSEFKEKMSLGAPTARRQRTTARRDAPGIRSSRQEPLDIARNKSCGCVLVFVCKHDLREDKDGHTRAPPRADVDQGVWVGVEIRGTWTMTHVLYHSEKETKGTQQSTGRRGGEKCNVHGSFLSPAARRARR